MGKSDMKNSREQILSSQFPKKSNMTWRRRGKKFCAMALALTMTATSPVMLPQLSIQADASSSSMKTATTFNNPMIYSDVPDIDIIRVDDAYYMVSTTMHLSPGCPVMKSTDLVNWEIVNYVYDVLDTGDEMSLRNGKSMYGNGQWASSIQYHNGTYYVAFNSNTTKTAYVYSTDDIEHGSWKKTDLKGFFHDMALFFDDDNNKVYVVYGSVGDGIRYVELNSDVSGVKQGGASGVLFKGNIKDGQDMFPNGYIIGGEGTHVMKKGDYYYVFNICWPNGNPRTEVCHRSKTFPSTEWEATTILNANFSNNGTTSGVAQGGLIDTKDGKWYGFMFQDHGAVGRTPVLTECTWKDNWPMLGKNGDAKTVSQEMTIPVAGSEEKTIVKSDEFYNDAEHRVFSQERADYESSVGILSAEEAVLSDGEKPRLELAENGDCENGTNGWKANETATIESVAEDPHGGNACIVAKGRGSTGAGPAMNLDGKLEAGKTYKFSAWLKYNNEDGPAEKSFNATLSLGTSWRQRHVVGSVKAKKGEWTKLECEWTIPETYEVSDFVNAGDYTGQPVNTAAASLFFETPYANNPTDANDKMDIYIDDLSVSTEMDDMVVNGNVENGTDGWILNEAGKDSTGNEGVLEVVEGGHESDHCIVARNRKGTGTGPAQDLSNKLTPGNTYTLTAWVKYEDGPEEKQINCTIQNSPNEGQYWEYRKVFCHVKAKKGEWTKMTATYTMPDDAITNANYLFFETPYVENQTKENDLMDLYVDDVSFIEQKADEKQVEQPGENDYNGSNLDLVWQWNHNPDNTKWSLTDREGYLRLTTGAKSTGILDARNTLTQRTYGPTCSGKIKMDISNMKSGDVAGLASFCYNYGYVAVKKEGNATKVVMVNAANNNSAKKDEPKEIEVKDFSGNEIYLKVDFNFAGGDKAKFYYSADGKTWTQIGNELAMSYELVHFMGSRFAIFNYATKSTGGFVDVDYFRVTDDITGTESPEQTKAASIKADASVAGVINTETELKISLDNLESGSHKSLKASVDIPKLMSVDDVVFNTSAIKGTPSYTFKNNRLILNVKGDDVSFSASDKLFATVKCRLNGYASADETVKAAIDYVSVDNGKTEYNVDNASASIKLTYLDTGAIAKKLGYSNPLVTQSLGADPYAIVYDGRVYVYMTADDYEYDENGNTKDNSFGYIKSLRVISSDDLINWTDHGEIKVAGSDAPAKWANHSWAPAIAYKKIKGKDKFFLYFANDASGIGVLEADTPLGPWKDPIGKALLTRQTAGCEGVVWCFDPAVLVDDDGSAYIYFGGGIDGKDINNPKTARVAELGDDMISIKGEAKEIDAPCMFEDSGICKYNGVYYYSYCSNFAGGHKDGYPGTGTICYMTSDNPMGPFEYKGEIFQNPSIWFGTGGNNHHATFVFNNKTYFIYHAQTVAKALDDKLKAEGKLGSGQNFYQKGYRSTHIDNIGFNSDGTIKPIKGTYAGISQLKTMNPFERIDAETIAWNAGILVSDCAEEGKLFKDYNRQVTDIQDGDWISAAQLDFGTKGTKTIKVKAASKAGGSVEIRTDSPQGKLIGTVKVDATGSETTFKEFTGSLSQTTGVKNIFLVFKGSKTDNIMNVDSYTFLQDGDGKEEDPQPQPEDKADTTALNASIKAAEEMLAKLTGADKEALQNAIDAAKAAAAKEGATQADIDAALATMNTAKDTAQKVIDKKNDTKKDEPTNPVNYVGKTFTLKSGMKFKITACSAAKKTVTVMGTKKNVKSITIPATAKYKNMTFKVTAVNKAAFKNQKKAVKAVIGKNVTAIGANAFSGDKKLAKVTFKGKAVKSIGSKAFAKVKKNVIFKAPKAKKAAYKKLLKKAKTKNYKVK